MSDAAEYEKKHVQEVYDVIAGHFSSTRHQRWPSVMDYIKALPNNSVIADVGCGNGKYLGSNPECTFLGSDASDEFVKICKDAGHTAIVANVLQLPYENASVDSFICIAMLHHLSTVNRRRDAIVEMCRILKPGCTGLIYVWSFEHGGQKKGKVVVKRDEQDTLIEWNLDQRFGVAEKHHRYYHMFKAGELEALVFEANRVSECSITVKESGFDHQNWFVIIEKS